ncbi:restriction endonuclease subunit S [Nocardia sp. NPDC046763]|uniref:restriction endonuclease subunit S n=1 Tax=Nocardia sp. NPDC046763 TaxID=3155256 RepID=UPI00340BA073
MPDLPTGWKPIRLSDAGTWLSGGTPTTDEPRFWGGEMPWISASSMKDFLIRDSDRKLTKSGATAGTQIIDKGTVLFVVRGMSLKKEFRVGVAQRELTFGQDCKAIIPSHGIDGTFLALALKARGSEILSMVDEAGHGTGRLPTDLISNLEVFIPPPAEQRRIVEIIETLDSQIDEISKATRKLAMLKLGITEHAFAELPLSLRLGQLIIGTPKNGIYKPSSYYGDSGAPIIRIDSFHQGKIKPLSSLLRLRLSAQEVNEYRVETDDIVVNRVNSIDYVGKSAIVPRYSEPVTFESNMMRCRIDQEITSAKFVALWLGTARAMRYFRSCAKSAIAQASINQLDVGSCPVPEADRNAQEKIVSLVSDLNFQEEVRNQEHRHLVMLKQGLMEDLLTGRVRSLEALHAFEDTQAIPGVRSRN